MATTGRMRCVGRAVTGQKAKWRRGWDSNPRYGCPYAAFRVRCFRPLSHLSGQFGRHHGGAERYIAMNGAGGKGEIAVFPVFFLDSCEGLNYPPHVPVWGIASRSERPEPIGLRFHRQTGSKESFFCNPAQTWTDKKTAFRSDGKSRIEHERIKNVRSHQDRR